MDYAPQDLTLHRNGPRPKCTCGRCKVCRQRGARNRRIAGLPPLNPQGGCRREERLKLPMEPTTIAYIAGLLDGEGCISHSRQDVWSVQIGMTDRGVIEFLGTLGGTVRAERRDAKGYLTLYRWRLIAAADVRGFLIAVLPYLRVKNADAVECLHGIGL